MHEIIIDDREPDSIINKLKSAMNVKVERMEIGDYFSSGVCIERKTWSDFISSIMSNRVFEQMHNLTIYEHPVLIITGDRNQALISRRTPHRILSSIRGAIASIVYKFRVPIIFCENDDEFAMQVCDIFRQIEKPSSERPAQKHRKSVSSREIQEDMLCCIPKVGLKKARMLLDKYGNIEDIIMLDSNRYMAIEGIGKKLAKDIEDAFK